MECDITKISSLVPLRREIKKGRFETNVVFLYSNRKRVEKHKIPDTYKRYRPSENNLPFIFQRAWTKYLGIQY
jgi:hypothetical protein